MPQDKMLRFYQLGNFGLNWVGYNYLKLGKKQILVVSDNNTIWIEKERIIHQINKKMH